MAYRLSSTFKMTAEERLLAETALTEHKIQKGDTYLVERPDDDEARTMRDSEGRFVSIMEIRGNNFDITIYYNKCVSWNEIEWKDEEDFED